MKTNEAVTIIKTKTGAEDKDIEILLEKSKKAGEFSDKDELEQWLNERFLPNCVSINEQEYAEMCIDALKILGTTAATDFGSSRQRDLGQLWADMTRGYLGEIAFKKFLEEKWNMKSELGHEIGELNDYLPMDIHKVKKDDEDWRSPKINIGVKTSKWNGIWFDIPGDQFNHSDIHVLVRLNVGRDHLFAFFKQISVFKDKVLKKGREIGCLSESESESLFGELPSFKPIPAYICGFVNSNAPHKELDYSGKLGRKHYTITAWRGLYRKPDLDVIKEKESVTDGNVKFVGIDRFSHDRAFLFNTGSLLWTKEDWDELYSSL